MDAFEQLAADIFWKDGYWVQTGVKVDLTQGDKLRIGRRSSPRWEIDLVAYHAERNELLALECKSYLDSGGVHAAHFEPGSKYAHRYKLFHDPILRQTVLDRLRMQSIARGLCRPDTQLRLGLIHGHATQHNAGLLTQIFRNKGWLLFGPGWLRHNLQRMAAESYENSTAAIVAKLLLRHTPSASATCDRPAAASLSDGHPTPT